MACDRRLRIHDLSMYCDGSLTTDGLTLAGVSDLAFYPYRSLLMDHVSVVPDHPTLRAYFDYLQELGFGASGFIPVQGTNLFKAILCDSAACARIRACIEDGWEIEFFSDSPASREFTRIMEIPEHQLRTVRGHVANTLGDKERLRILGHELGLGRFFPRFAFAYTEGEIVEAAHVILQDNDEVVIKRPDLASGTGCERFRRGDLESAHFRQFMEKFATGARNMIVEEWVDGESDDPMVDYSIQFHVRANGKVDQVFTSGQYIEDDGMTHAGNLVPTVGSDCLPRCWLQKERESIHAMMLAATLPLAKWARDQGPEGVGRIGFDLKANRRRVVVLESNARVTASTYPEAIRWQLRGGAVAMRNVFPSSLNDWQDVRRELEATHLGYCRALGRGIVIGNPICMFGGKPKFAAVCVGPSSTTAEAILMQVKAFFEASALVKRAM